MIEDTRNIVNYIKARQQTWYAPPKKILGLLLHNGRCSFSKETLSWKINLHFLFNSLQSSSLCLIRRLSPEFSVQTHDEAVPHLLLVVGHSSSVAMGPELTRKIGHIALLIYEITWFVGQLSSQSPHFSQLSPAFIAIKLFVIKALSISYT